MYRYIIPHVPPSNNQFIGRTNFREYQAQKKTWAMLVKAYCKPAPKKPIAHSVVTLAYCFGKIDLVLRRVDGADKRTEITVEEK